VGKQSRAIIRTLSADSAISVPAARDLMTEMQPEVYSIEVSDMLFIREKWFAVKLYLPIHDNSDVAALLKKLHHLLASPCQLRPARSRFRILFQTTQFVVFKLKVDFAQS